MHEPGPKTECGQCGSGRHEEFARRDRSMVRVGIRCLECGHETILKNSGGLPLKGARTSITSQEFWQYTAPETRKF